MRWCEILLVKTKMDYPVSPDSGVKEDLSRAIPKPVLERVDEGKAEIICS
jgi:hypothetical protein